MRRSNPFVALSLLALLLAPASATGAGIIAPSRVALGEPIEATVDISDFKDTDYLAYSWKTSPGSSALHVCDGQTVHIWATPGKHTIEVAVACFDESGDAPKLSIQRYAATITVGPAPDPDTISLADLVDGETANRLSVFYRDLAAAISGKKIEQSQIFWSVYLSLREASFGGDEGADEVFEIVDKRLENIVLIQDGEITPEKRAALAEELTAVSRELIGDKPPTPVPPPDPEPDPPIEDGPIKVLIVAETQDADPVIGGLKVDLRKPDTQKWFMDNGHSLVIYDDDAKRADGATPKILADHEEEWRAAGLPAIVLIDPDTDKALHAARLKDGTTADNIIELIRQHGG